MEMQWLDSTSVHSGEFFHGPFEVTDKDTNFILLMSIGRTRALDERAKRFLDKYAERVEIVDAKELGLDMISDEVSEFFNPILFYSILSEYRSALADVRNHDLDVRRYMGKWSTRRIKMKVLGLGDNVVDKYENLGIMYPGGNSLNFAVLQKLGHESSFMGVLAQMRRQLMFYQQ